MTTSRILIDRFMPRADVAERHEIIVAAPAHVVFETACSFDMQSLPLVRFIFNLRGRLLGATGHGSRPARGLVAETAALGWRCLSERPGREYLAGAAARPWEADVIFRPIPPDGFASFDEPGYVKIAWSLEAEPLSGVTTRFRTQTRVIATDAEARRRFRRYWRVFGIGIVAIRWLMLRALRSEAERQWNAGVTTAPQPWGAEQNSQGSFT